MTLCKAIAIKKMFSLVLEIKKILGIIALENTALVFPSQIPRLMILSAVISFTALCPECISPT